MWSLYATIHKCHLLCNTFAPGHEFFLARLNKEHKINELKRMQIINILFPEASDDDVVDQFHYFPLNCFGG